MLSTWAARPAQVSMACGPSDWKTDTRVAPGATFLSLKLQWEWLLGTQTAPRAGREGTGQVVRKNVAPKAGVVHEG